MQQLSVPLPFPIDLRGTLARVRHGSNDPSWRFAADGVWRASRFGAGPATLHLAAVDQRVEARAWGDGAADALDAVADLVGVNDDHGDFDPQHPLVARLWRDFGDRRIPRSGAVAEALIASVLEQRVTTYEARRAQIQLTNRWGEPAPGPIDLLVPPDPEVLAGIPYYDLHVLGVEKKRADTVRRVAANARRIDALALLPPAEGHRRLLDITGVGPWTAAEVALVALGDPDAVPVGDAHLPSDITYALTGRAVDDDDAMLEALEPFRGQRGRVVGLISAGGIHAPRRSPRYAPRDQRGS